MAKQLARISVSDLVRFWKWYSDVTDRPFAEILDKETQLIEEILRERVDTYQQALGKHIHAIIEDVEAHAVTINDTLYYGDEETGLMHADDVERLLDVVGDGGIEVPAVKAYIGDEDTDIIVSMRLDRVTGFLIRDIKTVWSAPTDFLKTMKAEGYEDSPQALFYADAFGATAVEYVLLYMGQQPPLLTLKDIQVVTVDTSDRAYVHDRCQRVVSTFWDWCKAHKLQGHYLQRFINNPELEVI